MHIDVHLSRIISYLVLTASHFCSNVMGCLNSAHLIVDSDLIHQLVTCGSVHMHVTKGWSSASNRSWNWWWLWGAHNPRIMGSWGYESNFCLPSQTCL